MMQMFFYLPMLIVYCSLQSTVDARYEKTLKYIHSNKDILAAIHETLPAQFQSDTSIILVVADSLIRPFLSPDLTISLKYGGAQLNKVVYDSLRHIEMERLYQYGQLYQKPAILPELKKLSMNGTPNAVLFFSRSYDNILRVLILPIKVESVGKLYELHDTVRTQNPIAEELSVINTDFRRMSSFNTGVSILFLFDEKDDIKSTTFSTIIFD